MCSRAYGKDDPSQDDAPIMRSTSVSYWKKSISYFFNTTSKWNEEAKTGNPTQSKKINNLIKVIRKNETRGNGAESQEDRPFTHNEFRQVLDLMGSPRWRAAMNYQYQMIARIDDTAHATKNTLKPSPHFPKSSGPRMSRTLQTVWYRSYCLLKTQRPMPSVW